MDNKKIKNFVVFRRYNDLQNEYLTNLKPTHFDTIHPEYGLKFTRKQAIKLSGNFNREARETYSYYVAYGYHITE
jgi:hypothetical protein